MAKRRRTTRVRPGRRRAAPSRAHASADRSLGFHPARSARGSTAGSPRCATSLATKSPSPKSGSKRNSCPQTVMSRRGSVSMSLMTTCWSSSLPMVYARGCAPTSTSNASAAATACVTLPHRSSKYQRASASRREGAPSRGAIGWVLKSLKVLGIDLQGRTALALASSVEKRAGLRRPGRRLPAGLETGQFELAPCTLACEGRRRSTVPGLAARHALEYVGELW